MDILLKAIDNILYFYEESPSTKRYMLTKDEYLLLYSLSLGNEMLDLVDYYGRSRVYVYKLRKQLIKKFAVKTLYEVLYHFGQLDGRKLQ